LLGASGFADVSVRSDGRFALWRASISRAETKGKTEKKSGGKKRRADDEKCDEGGTCKAYEENLLDKRELEKPAMESETEPSKKKKAKATRRTAE
jgi:hypothetical protein